MDNWTLAILKMVNVAKNLGTTGGLNNSRPIFYNLLLQIGYFK